MEQMNLMELENINAGGGPIANTINATAGSVGIGNALAIGVLAGPAWGVAVAAAGGICIYNAVRN